MTTSSLSAVHLSISEANALTRVRVIVATWQLKISPPIPTPSTALNTSTQDPGAIFVLTPRTAATTSRKLDRSDIGKIGIQRILLTAADVASLSATKSA